ncbi:MAG: hypothetical protein OEM02_12605, partial [Desulfobulbaceae bacterium]|nr:hypothetical protein [Desulfobulbaceae bacterium]
CEDPYPAGCDCEDRGWWSTVIQGQIIFYDPADLAKVAQGTLAANRPQPYAVLDLDPYLYHLTSTREKHHISAIAYDRANGRLYIFEPFGDGDKPLVHAWSLTGSSTDTPSIVPPVMLLLNN